jgi:hypothetical protein
LQGCKLTKVNASKEPSQTKQAADDMLGCLAITRIATMPELPEVTAHDEPTPIGSFGIPLIFTIVRVSEWELITTASPSA